MKKLLALVTAFFVLVFASPAYSHSALVYTDPSPNSHIQIGPKTVKLVFASPFVFLEDSYQAEVQILDPDNHAVDPICSTAAIKSLMSVYDFQKTGRHTVNWRAVADDGHVIGGTYKFTVDQSDRSSIDENVLCQDAGLQVGQLKKASHENFEASPSFDPAILIYILLAALLIFAAYVLWVRKRSSRG